MNDTNYALIALGIFLVAMVLRSVLIRTYENHMRKLHTEARGRFPRHELGDRPSGC